MTTAATEPSTAPAAAAAPVPDDPTPAGPAAEGQPTDSPAAPENDTPKKKPAALAAAVGASITNWWGFVRQPMSLGEAWRRSGVIDARRIPGESNLLAAFWWWSNRTDRVLLFLLVMVLPTVLNGPILYCAVRPSRRWGLYAVLFVLFVVVPYAAKG